MATPPPDPAAGAPLVGPRPAGGRRPLVGPRPVHRHRGRWAAVAVVPVGVVLAVLAVAGPPGPAGAPAAGAADVQGPGALADATRQPEAMTQQPGVPDGAEDAGSASAVPTTGAPGRTTWSTTAGATPSAATAPGADPTPVPEGTAASSDAAETTQAAGTSAAPTAAPSTSVALGGWSLPFPFPLPLPGWLGGGSGADDGTEPAPTTAAPDVPADGGEPAPGPVEGDQLSG